MHEWKETPDGWELPLTKTKDPSDRVLVSLPDSVGHCEITLIYRGEKTIYGYSFGSDAAKTRAEKIFKQWY